MDPITPPVIETTVARYGLLGGALVILAGVLVYLFRLYLKTNDAIGTVREAAAKASETMIAKAADERAIAAMREAEREHAADMREEKLRTEFEKKHAEVVERYARELAEQVKATRENEAAIRREFDDRLDAVAEQTIAANTRHIATIEKLTDRIVQVPKGRGGTY